MTVTDLLNESERKQQLEKLLPDYIRTQRWFGGKSRAIRSVLIANTMPILGTEAVLAILTIAYEEGPSDTYQLPIATADSAAPSVIATLANTTLIDATQLPEVRGALLALTEAEIDGAVDLASRVSSAEQSNTSIIFGDRLILKLFRKLQPGENPDVEISRFLTTVADFPHIPAYRGSLSAEDGATLAFAQDYAANDGDGWQWLTTRIASFTTLSSRPERDGSIVTRSGETRISGGDETLAAATLLGQRTAELHLALATPTHDEAFCSARFEPNDLAADAARLQAQADATFAALKSSLHKIPAALTPLAARLLGKRSVITAQAQALATTSPFRVGRRIRIHGDYHLGQVLRTADDFVLVDFEGEPAKPLAERRRKQSPLRDVAGMLRSFSYAAATAAQNAPHFNTAAWEAAASNTFLDAYSDTISALPELTPQSDQRAILLRAYLLEKALYELLYELNNRPDWIAIPLGGITSLLEETA